MIKGLIAGAVVALISSALGGFRPETVSGSILLIVLGVVLDLFLGRRGAAVVALAGFAITAFLFLGLPLLLSHTGTARVEIRSPIDIGLTYVIFIAYFVLLWAIFYGVYVIVSRYVD